MSATTQVTAVPVCPRCRSNATGVRGVSPIAGVWTVYGCDTCFYAWRSTEPEENTNPDKYPAVFSLEPENLPKLQVAPTIPPLRANPPLQAKKT
jgi:vanillate/4-hydroxybenzoate decarboxylase subunit D